MRVAPIRSGDRVIGLVAISSDVTEQRRAHADRDRFFSLSLDMLIVVTPNGLPQAREPGLRPDPGA